MIVSHSRRFIFLKTRKTAGTSVEIFLSRHCGPLDILTPISPEDELARYKSVGGVARNFVITRLPTPKGSGLGATADFFEKNAGKLAVDQRLYNHTPGREVRDIVGERIWDSYFKFTIERDPIEQIQSLYFWRKSEGRWRGSFSEFLESGIPLRDRNADIYVDQHDELLVDFVVDQSRLIDDFAEVCRILEIPFDGTLPRAKGGVPRDEEIVVTPELRKEIEQRFDIEHATHLRAVAGEFRKWLKEWEESRPAD